MIGRAKVVPVFCQVHLIRFPAAWVMATGIAAIAGPTWTGLIPAFGVPTAAFAPRWGLAKNWCLKIDFSFFLLNFYNKRRKDTCLWKKLRNLSKYIILVI